MATELSTLMHNQLGEPLAHFLSTQGENLAASERAVTVALPTIVLTILKYVNGNRDQTIALYNQVMGSNPQPYHDLITQLNKIPFNKITEIGKPLVTQLLGSNAQPTAAQIAHSSGVSNSGAYQLLNVALPLVLSLLRSRGWTAQEFYTILGSQSCWLNKTLSANLLSLLDIGSSGSLCASVLGLASGLTGITGAPVSVAAESSGWTKLLAFLLLGGVSVFGLRTCMNQETSPIAPQPIVQNHLVEQQASIESNDVSAAASTAIGLHNALAASEPVAASEPEIISEPVATSEPEIISEPIATSEPMVVSDSTDTSAPPANESRVIAENGMIKFYFAVGMSRIAKNANAIAKETIVAGKSGKKLIISGYTDSTGNTKNNELLSKKRAEVVKAFFIKHGVSAKNIELRRPESTIGAQGKNQEGRRVEVQITD
ncbi:OmpA family protein [Simonsiella muelleri]|uniref:OmpA family protein n=1 Tax=Simonsiella muelleri TaxID=72 RepID=UPI0028D4FE2B|nr:OmpA family protein [Simonsiella muelleri]